MSLIEEARKARAEHEAAIAERMLREDDERYERALKYLLHTLLKGVLLPPGAEVELFRRETSPRTAYAKYDGVSFCWDQTCQTGVVLVSLDGDTWTELGLDVSIPVSKRVPAEAESRRKRNLTRLAYAIDELQRETAVAKD